MIDYKELNDKEIDIYSYFGAKRVLLENDYTYLLQCMSEAIFDAGVEDADGYKDECEDVDSFDELVIDFGAADNSNAKEYFYDNFSREDDIIESSFIAAALWAVVNGANNKEEAIAQCNHMIGYFFEDRIIQFAGAGVGYGPWAICNLLFDNEIDIDELDEDYLNQEVDTCSGCGWTMQMENLNDGYTDGEILCQECIDSGDHDE